MPLDLSRTLVVAISSTALFDLSDVDKEFHKAFEQDSERAVTAYREYMLKNENQPLQKGTGYPAPYDGHFWTLGSSYSTTR